MARPRKEQQGQYRLPTYHPATNRWRLRIDHGHGTKAFWWPGDGQGQTPPPEVIAAAVAIQDEWRLLVQDWYWIGKAMKMDQPDKDWSRPVWVDRAKAQAVVDRGWEEIRVARQHDRRRVLYHVASNGLSDLIAHAQQPGALAMDPKKHHKLRDARPEVFAKMNAEGEQLRVQLLAELAPARRRSATETVRQAIRRYLAGEEARTRLTMGDRIEKSTYDAKRWNLLGAFGLSTAPTEHEIRRTPIDLDALIPAVDHATLEAFTRYWHAPPEGIGSEHTVKNYLTAARAFLHWCGEEYDFSFPNRAAKLFTAGSVKTPAEPWKPERIRQILAQSKARGHGRLKLYLLLGLLLGYGQTDCAEIAEADYLREGSERFIWRYRSKEDRPKNGSRPIRVKHWIAPELGDTIDRNRGANPDRYLFNGALGTVLTDEAVTGVWTRAVQDAGDTLCFKQLRKIGYNRIKHHAGGKLEVAELWDGHSNGVADNYDDGIFLPVIEAQKLFAEELRAERIL